MARGPVDQSGAIARWAFLEAVPQARHPAPRCDRCHGANQEGLVGPSLVTALKTLSKDEFVQGVMNGRPNTQMIAFSGNAEVVKNIDQLYAYLKGRSDGAITKARVEAMQ